jgi:hypothetical protein
MDASKRCGAHVEIVKTAAIRLTRCACGTYHLSLLAKGISLQLSADELRAVARDLGATAEELAAGAPAATSSARSERIN